MSPCGYQATEDLNQKRTGQDREALSLIPARSE